MIRNGFYYPDKIWKNTLHKNQVTGTFDGACWIAFIEGNRRAGKSVGVGIFSIADFIMYGYEHTLIRRYKENFDAEHATEEFWIKSFPYIKEFPEIVKSDIKLQEIYPLDQVERFDWENHKIDFKADEAYIDEKPFCYKCWLNGKGPNNYKNRGFSQVRRLIYDEYVAEDGKFLQNEVSSIYNIYDTTARGRDHALKDTSIILMSNKVSDSNDFHTEFGIDKELREGTNWLYRPKKGYCLENVFNEAAAKEVEESCFGQSIAQTQRGKAYLGYAQGNKDKDDTSFVERLSGRMRYVANFIYEDTTYAMFINLDQMMYYFTDADIEEEGHETYALTLADHSLNTVLISTQLRKYMNNFKLYYEQGLMRFNSMRSKKVFMAIYRYL